MEYSDILNQLLDDKDLSREDARDVMEEIATGRLTPAQVGAFLVALRVKGENPQEIAGFVETLRNHVVRVPHAQKTIFDTAGTGGDGKHSFNISTVTALVLAACGVPVAKHGNRAASSKCGSADVLEALGMKIDMSPEQAGKCLQEIGFAFLFAPLYHPAFKHVVPIRKELNVRTVFNFLGPLLNPAKPGRQIIGVPNESVQKLLGGALIELGVERVAVIRSEDGYDELTTTSPVYITEIAQGEKRKYSLDPAEFGFRKARPEDLNGGDAQENARIISEVLEGTPGPCTDTVVFNSGFALMIAGKAQSVQEGINAARDVIEKGKAKSALEKFVNTSNSE